MSGIERRLRNLAVRFGQCIQPPPKVIPHTEGFAPKTSVSDGNARLVSLRHPDRVIIVHHHESSDRFEDQLCRALSDERDAELGLRLSDKQAVVVALLQRQQLGKTTALRDLHAHAGVAQPDAVKILQNLREMGLVSFEFPLEDALAAEIQITRLAMKRFAKIGLIRS